jgi:hypothetical protein
VIHGHFYQPPREDPWLEEVPREPGAWPYHDWNQRIEHECYRAVVAARVPGPEGRIARIVNALEHASFDFGPTLLAWLEHAAPDTYRAILAADRASVARLGHGNAIAMPAHHVILPLATRRDAETEVRWGIAEFRRRFGRAPDGMWLPETAVDDQTLDVLAAEGIRYTVLAPHQVRDAPGDGLPVLYQTAAGRTIALFIYDGPVSHDLAFGPLLADARAWAARMTADVHRRVAAVATDGETFGHHHRFGEMALAAVFESLAGQPGVRIENFASVLAQHPPTHSVTLVAPSSWSCPHGVERWRADCGCRVHPERHTHQGWRAVLRESLDWLARELHQIYEEEGTALFGDPWKVRDDYGSVAWGPPGETLAFARDRARDAGRDGFRAAELLELERNALRMFISCGWFFDDVSGVESALVLRHAARAIELAGAAATKLERELLERLRHAESNVPAAGNGRDVYLRDARPRIPPAARVAAAVAGGRALGAAPEVLLPPAWAIELEDHSLTARHRRTGGATTLGVAVHRPSAGHLSVVLTSPDGSMDREVGLRDLPDAAQEILLARIRADLVETWLTGAERRAVSEGAPLATTVEHALEDAVAGLAADGAAGMERVFGLLDLLELLGHPVPFDAQTTFYRVRAGLPAERARSLEPVGHRLGFA